MLMQMSPQQVEYGRNLRKEIVINMKKEINSLVKKVTACVLATGMLIAGIIVVPKQADAAVVEDKVIFEEGYDIKTYWNSENPKAPVKAGYVFGGWYSAKEENAFLTKEQAAQATTAYAKFVPAQVLSVKAQNSQIKDSETQVSVKVDKDNIDTISEDNPMWIRVMSSLDSTNYEKVGFDIYLANRKRVENKDGGKLLETTKIYDGVLEGDNVVKANDIFGGVSKYVSVWKLTKIDTPSNKDKIIYVRPYWYTMDGTKVEGLAKYVHIEDDYMNYISVPVNILDKEDVAQVAAGAVNVTYTNAQGKNVALEFKEVEPGRLLPEMKAAPNGNVIKMVGNTEVDSDNKDDMNNLETLYANIRFIKPSTDATDVDVDFKMDIVEFCDWKEEEVTISETWDVKYDVP